MAAIASGRAITRTAPIASRGYDGGSGDTVADCGTYPQRPAEVRERQTWAPRVTGISTQELLIGGVIFLCLVLLVRKIWL
jgi:hypothetical protein